MTAKAVIVRGTTSAEAKQGKDLRYGVGISAESAGSQHLWMGRVTIPAGARTKAHIHEHHDTAIHVLEGEIEMNSGSKLQHRDTAKTGDWILVPANVAHLAVNRTQTEVIAIVTRTDPNEQESVVLLPELEAKIP